MLKLKPRLGLALVHRDEVTTLPRTLDRGANLALASSMLRASASRRWFMDDGLCLLLIHLFLFMLTSAFRVLFDGHVVLL